MKKELEKKETVEEARTEEPKEESKKKKGHKLFFIIIILLLLIVIGVLIFFLLTKKDVTVNTGGGIVVSNVVIKDGEIEELPEIKKEGMKVVAYVDQNNKVIRKGVPSKNIVTITPIYIDDGIVDLFTVEFYDGETLVHRYQMPNGGQLVAPIDPEKDGYEFNGWTYEDGSLLVGLGQLSVVRNYKFQATWIPKNKEYVTVTVMSLDKEVGSFKQEKGTAIELPSPIKIDGYYFEGWKDKEGNLLTSEYVLENDITITAIFAKYTCPEGCTQSEDGKTCSTTETTNPTTSTGCPAGYTVYSGKCINKSNKYVYQFDGPCKSGYTIYDEQFSLGVTRYCAKTANKVTTTTCPGGFNLEGNICKKINTINCEKEDI